MRKLLIVLVLVWLAVPTLNGFDGSQGSYGSCEVLIQEDAHSQSSHKRHQAAHARPTNQVAVLTVWAEAENMLPTAKFYEDVLGLKLISSNTDHYVFDTDGTFIVIMEGRLEQPRDPKRRWPMFALIVPDLDLSIKALQAEKIELPWGIEESTASSPSSRWVMFHDPAGNLIELVEWH